MVNQLVPLEFKKKIARKVIHLPGGYRMTELFRRAHSHLNQDIHLKDFDGDLEMIVNLADHIGSHIFWQGYYSADQLRVANQILKPDDVVLDVGANAGEFSVFSAKRVAHGRLYAFEPTKYLFGLASKNLALNNFENATVFQLGLGAKEEALTIYKKESPGEDGAINKGLNSLFQGSEFDASEQIEITTLDIWRDKHSLHKIDLIKMDIEGAELFALRGGERTIRELKPKLIIEVNPATCQRAGYSDRDLTDYIRQFGYKIFNIERGGRLREVTACGPFTRDIHCTF